MYDEAGYFYREKINFGYLVDWSTAAIDPERKLGFCVGRRRHGDISVTPLVDIKEGESLAEFGRSGVIEALVTAPAKNKASELQMISKSARGRATLNFGSSGSLFMIGNYLVRGDASENVLVLLDFWPRW